MSRGKSPHLPSWVQSPMPVALRSHALVSRSNSRMPDISAAESTPAAKSADDFDVASLLAGARGGDLGNLGELLSHYRKYLLVLATAQIEKRLAPRVSPSDIVQETMIKAQRHLGQFRGQTERELLAWLRQILATRLARFVEEHLLAAKRDIRREISIEHFQGGMDHSAPQLKSLLRADVRSPSEAAQKREDSVVVADLLAQLPGPYRDILIWRNTQGLSFEEIAVRLDRKPGATRMLWLRAIEKLRTIYRREKLHDP
jgi:RNA polymerase sigma-70 factor (ECF subfamily)